MRFWTVWKCKGLYIALHYGWFVPWSFAKKIALWVNLCAMMTCKLPCLGCLQIKHSRLDIRWLYYVLCSYCPRSVVYEGIFTETFVRGLIFQRLTMRCENSRFITQKFISNNNVYYLWRKTQTVYIEINNFNLDYPQKIIMTF